MTESEATRLFLVTPPRADPETFPDRLAVALSAGDVAAVLIATGGSERELGSFAGRLVPIIQAAGAAALILDDTRIAGHVKADGVQIGSGYGDLCIASDSYRGKRILGAGNLTSRHTAMEAGQIADYVFFGRPHGDTHYAAHPKALELTEWWSELMEVPAVVMAGRSLESIGEAAATGAAFVAVNEAVWSHPAGPAEATRRALAALSPAELEPV